MSVERVAGAGGRGALAGVWPVFRRELAGYFVTPVAYVFIVVFLVLTGWITFQEGRLLEAGQATLRGFFAFHPWLYLILIPALAMRLWAEERRGGTIELLLTLPVTTAGAVVGKFLAAWVFAGVALALTFPAWLTVGYLGSPDHGAIACGYIGSFLLAGAALAVSGCVSAATRSQVIALVVSVVVCLGLVLVGLPAVVGAISGMLPGWMVEAISQMGFLTQFDAMGKGVIDGRAVLYFGSMIAVFLVATVVMVDAKRAG